MKQRVRKLVRLGWFLVEIPYKVDDTNAIGKFRIKTQWCEDNVPKDEWVSKLAYEAYRKNSMRFLFKEERFAAWFRLSMVE